MSFLRLESSKNNTLSLSDFLTAHDQPLSHIRVTFGVEAADRSRSEEAAFATAIPLNVFEIDGPGRYLVKAAFDKTVLGTFPLRIDGSAIAQAEPETSD